MLAILCCVLPIVIVNALGGKTRRRLPRRGDLEKETKGRKWEGGDQEETKCYHHGRQHAVPEPSHVSRFNFLRHRLCPPLSDALPVWPSD